MTSTALGSTAAGVVRAPALVDAWRALDPHPAAIIAIPATATSHRDLTVAI
jgi:hypothetical protein